MALMYAAFEHYPCVYLGDADSLVSRRLCRGAHIDPV